MPVLQLTSVSFFPLGPCELVAVNISHFGPLVSAASVDGSAQAWPT